MPSQSIIKLSIIKLLTSSGVGSRRQITVIINRGGISVNGSIIENFNELVDPANDLITIDGKRISIKEIPLFYLMLNKPKGVISSTSDERGAKTIIDLLPDKYRQMRLYPVGRLDKDSTGLILITNDGDLTLWLTHPRFEQEKEYVAVLGRNLCPDDKEKLEHGIQLDDGRTSPAKVRALEYPQFSYSVTIHEGKKRQVRRMFAALGYSVLELKRIRLGNLELGTLPEGEIHELTSKQLQTLKKGKSI